MKMKHWITSALVLAGITAAAGAHAGSWMKCGKPYPDGSVIYTDIACPKAYVVKQPDAQLELTILEGKQLRNHVLAELGDASALPGILARVTDVVSDSTAPQGAAAGQGYEIVLRDANGMLLRRWTAPRDESLAGRLLDVFTSQAPSGASAAPPPEGAEATGEAASAVRACTRCLYCTSCGIFGCDGCTCVDCPKPSY